MEIESDQYKKCSVFEGSRDGGNEKSLAFMVSKAIVPIIPFSLILVMNFNALHETAEAKWLKLWFV